MTQHGHIHKGTIVLEKPLGLPDGAEVEVDIKEIRNTSRETKKRNIAKLADGINYDFDALQRLREASKL